MNTLPCLLILTSSMFVIQLINSNPMAYAVVNQDRYWSVLSGIQQIPPINTSAVGYAGFKFPDDMTWLLFTVNAENIGNVSGIYLHQKDKNRTGTVVLDLLKAEREHPTDDVKIVNITSKGKLTGTLSVGGATKDDLQGQLKGKSLSNLHEMMVNGSAYISIQTKDFPNGEIRGNSFVGLHRLFPDTSDIKWD